MINCEFYKTFGILTFRKCYFYSNNKDEIFFFSFSNPISVVLGTHNLEKVDDGTMRYNVTRCKHPDFNSVTSGNDIMLLKASSLTFKF